MREIETVVLVNECDEEVGEAEKLQAHQEGLLHRAFSAFVFREHEGEIQLLLQQRALSKYHCAGLWSNTCCSHPRKDESIIAAAQRRTQEELDLKVKLKAVGHFIYRAELDNNLIEHELDHVLVGRYIEQSFTPNPDEVMSTAWVNVKEIPYHLQEHKENYTPWFRQALQLALNALDKIGFKTREAIVS